MSHIRFTHASFQTPDPLGESASPHLAFRGGGTAPSASAADPQAISDKKSVAPTTPGGIPVRLRIW
jgi:hypothetical protein